MEIDQLRMVLMLAKSGSMTNTAKQLEVTQPALTYQINKIESELGFKVFHRKRSGTSLTLEGDFFCNALWRVLVTYDEAVGMARVLAYDEAVQRAKDAAQVEDREGLSKHARAQAAHLEGSCVIGSVQGDFHEFGKNLVRTMIEIKGVEIEDLGNDTSPQRFVDYLYEHPTCTIVLLSASRTKILASMRETVEAIDAAGLRDRVTVMVGGSAVNEEYAQEIGADIYTREAAEAAQVVFDLLSGNIDEGDTAAEE